MHSENLPVVEPDRPLRECLWEMTRGRLGLVLVLDDGRPEGIVTDGDLRRALLSDRNAMERPISRFMTRQPVTIGEDEKLVEAERMMRSGKIKALVATDADGTVTGILEIFDE